MVDQSPSLGLDLFYISPDYAFFTTHLCLTQCMKLPSNCSVSWQKCLKSLLSSGHGNTASLLFCSWCKNLADLDNAFCPVLKHQGLGLLDALLLLNICLIIKITCSHMCVFNRLVPSQFTHLSVNEFTLCRGLDFSLVTLEML